MVFNGSRASRWLHPSDYGLGGLDRFIALHPVEVAQRLPQGQAMIIERLFRNPKTTLLGLILISLCFLLVFLEKASLTEVSTFMVGAFALLFLKDPKDEKATGGKQPHK